MKELDYPALAKRARELLKDVDPSLAQAAYPAVLSDLITQARREGAGSTSPSLRTTPTSELVPTSPSALDAFLTRNIDTAKYDSLFLARGKLTDKSLAVLKIARDEFGIDGMVSSEIASILTRKFRVGQVHASNVSRDLGQALEFVSRIDVDGQQKYVLTLKGETRLSDALKEL